VASRKPKGPPEKIRDCGVKKEDGFVYFVDRRGNLMRMQRGVVRAREELVFEKAIEKREKGYMYYLDDDGALWKEPD
jgi:hypothetical protein